MLKGKRAQKKGVKAVQAHARGAKKGQDLSGNYKRQHKTLNQNYHNLQPNSFLLIQHHA